MDNLELILQGFDVLWSNLIGVPYEEGGRGPMSYDCYGIVMEYYRRRGIIIPDYHSLGSSEEKNAEVLNAMDNGWREVPEPEIHSVVLFKVHRAPHIGVIVKEGWFLHVGDGHNAVLQSLNHPLWVKRIVGFYQYEDIRDCPRTEPVLVP